LTQLTAASKNIKIFQIGSLAHDNFCGNDHHAATPTPNPDCRALPTQIVALYPAPTRHPLPRFSQHTREKKKRRIPRRQYKEETMTENEGNVTEQPVAEPEAPAATEQQAAPQPAEPVAEQPAAEQTAESPAEQTAAPASNDAPIS
jgi:hypothetical protein